MTMKDKTKQILINAGWSEERHIDTSNFRSKYQEIGLEYPQEIDDFLSKFGMLEIYPTKESRFDVSFNATKAMGCNLDAEYFEECLSEYDVDEAVYPVGEACRRNLLVLMSRTMRFYCFTDGLLLKLGDSIEEMLDCIAEEGQDATELD